MNLKITSIAMERFRAFRDLKIEGLGRVNLFTGKNNTGKSSVLEALRILTSEAAPSVILSILRYREEDSGETEEEGRAVDMDSMFLVSTLFHGFPPLSESPESIIIAANGGSKRMKLTLRVAWLSEERDSEGSRRLVAQQPDLFGEVEGSAALVVETAGSKRATRFEDFRRYALRGRMIRPDSADEPRMPCVYVSPYGGEKTATLGALWDRIALSDSEKDVVEALKIIDPQISAVSMVGGESPRRSRTAIVRADNIARPVPLRSFGDGLNRLFGIILSLVNAKDGLLLIDEFENGMHHTVQLDVWRTVFRLAQKLDIQVFATSHSWDSIEAFQKAAAETPEDGVLVRLARKGEDVIPTVFAEDELGVATRDGIELR
jgi:hypothetical protein